MDGRKLVLKETALVSIGQMLCLGVMLVVYALLGEFAPKVLWGGLVGSFLAVLNFFFTAMIADLAADRAERQDVSGAQKLIKGSYPVRLLVLAVLLFACAKSGLFDVLALVLPLAFVRITILVSGFFRKKGV